MLENLLIKVREPKVLKALGVALGSLVAVGAAAMIYNAMNEEEGQPYSDPYAEDEAAQDQE